MPSVPTPSIADTRQDQMFPTLDPSEIKPVRRFGQRRTFAPGEALAKVGDRSCALSIVLSGSRAGRRWSTPRRADRWKR